MAWRTRSYIGETSNLTELSVVLHPHKAACKCILSQVLTTLTCTQTHSLYSHMHPYARTDARMHTHTHTRAVMGQEMVLEDFRIEVDDELEVIDGEVPKVNETKWTPCVLCQPVYLRSGEVVGVLEGQDKSSGAGIFDDEDVSTVSLISDILGTTIERLQDANPDVLVMPERKEVGAPTVQRKHRSWGTVDDTDEIPPQLSAAAASTPGAAPVPGDVLKFGVPGAVLAAGSTLAPAGT